MSQNDAEGSKIVDWTSMVMIAPLVAAHQGRMWTHRERRMFENRVGESCITRSFFFSLNVIWVMELRTMRSEGNEALIGGIRNTYYRILVEILERR
jgi:hypothetical protein